MVWECQACGYIHDEKSRLDKEERLETDFVSGGLPPDWTCPVCGVGPEFFEEVSGRSS